MFSDPPLPPGVPWTVLGLRSGASRPAVLGSWVGG